MHIVQVTEGEIPPKGSAGVGRIITWIIEEYVKMGHQVTLLTHHKTDFLSKNPLFNYKIYSGADYRDEVPQDADIVHLHNPYENAIVPNKTPYLATCHRIEKNRALPFDNTVFVSPSHAKNYGGVHYVYNGVPVDEIPLLRNRGKEIFYLATLNFPSKNPKSAINMAYDLNIPINLTGGWLKDSKKIWGLWLIRYLFNKKIIKEHGPVDDDFKYNIASNCLFLCHLVKLHEPFGIAVHESLAAGLPVICSPNGAMSDFIEHGKNGFIVNTYKEALIEAKKLLCMSETEIEELANTCRSTAITSKKCAQDYLEYYAKIIQNKGRLYHKSEQPTFIYNPGPAVKIKKSLF